jgi:hypothetical protein
VRTFFTEIEDNPSIPGVPLSHAPTYPQIPRVTIDPTATRLMRGIVVNPPGVGRFDGDTAEQEIADRQWRHRLHRIQTVLLQKLPYLAGVALR